MIEKNTKTEEISYAELARRVGDCVLNNEIHSLSDREIGDWDEFNGSQSYCYKHETEEECEANGSADCEYECHEIYQEYIISQSGAEYLERNTDEVVFYNERLDMYLWAITHFGTSWDGVFTQIKA
jgi:hypothetical protein